MEKHVQDAAPHQHPDNIRVNEGWRDLSEVKKLIEEWKYGEAKPDIKLLEEWRQRETEPDIKLLLGEVNGVVRLLLSRCKVTIYKKYENVVQNVKMLPFKKNSIGHFVQVCSALAPLRLPF